jgi:hypothetical protein
MSRMGFVKQKASNAGKITFHQFKEVKEEYLADITAEVLLNEIPPDLIINWDQTPLNYVPTGDWTMNLAGEKVIPVAGTSNKRQITAVLAVTLSGEYLAPQIIYQGTTNRCHPTVEFPAEWDIWRTPNHWSNESTMERYLNKVIIPYISKKESALKLPANHRALVISDRGISTIIGVQ